MLTTLAYCVALSACGGGSPVNETPIVDVAKVDVSQPSGTASAIRNAITTSSQGSDAGSAQAAVETPTPLAEIPTPDSVSNDVTPVANHNIDTGWTTAISPPMPTARITAVQASSAAKFKITAAPLLVLLGAGAGSRSTNCTVAGGNDFVDNDYWTLRRLMPRDCRIVQDNPVSFSWTQPKDRDLNQPWVLTVVTEAGQVMVTRNVASPRVTLDTALAVGMYRWHVSYTAISGAIQTSSWRRFEVASSTGSTPLPTAVQLLATVAARSSPRLLPSGTSWSQIALAAQAGEYKNAFYMLGRTADSSALAALTPSPESRTRATFTTDAAYASWQNSLMSLTSDELRHIEALSFAWRLTGTTKYRDAAIARILALAAWDPTGASSEVNQPQANRKLYLALAMGMDLLGSDLSASEKSMVALAFEARIKQAALSLDSLDATPYASFANTGIHYAAQALLLVAGLPEFPNSAVLLQKVWPLYVTQFQAFGEEDGGYAGSVAYAWYDMYVASRSIATLLTVANVDISARSYVRKMGDFLMATTMPNTSGLTSFGDGTEEKNLYVNYSADAFRLYAAVTGSPAHAWYWRARPENVGELGYITPLHYLVMVRNSSAVAPIQPTQSDWIFEDVGNVAFNTDMSSTRSAVQFRSSRFGSYNHGHADQNSFTLSSKGVNVLINSGYYPYYMSPHHATIARATRYQNAVTFDGGIGQAESLPAPAAPTKPISSMEARGAIINANANTAAAVVTGDATLAYRAWDASTATWKPLLSNAVRTLAYLKNERVLIVYDWLTSDTPRQWELNYHAVQAFSVSGNTLVAHNGSATACIDHYGAAGSLATRSGFEIAPENGLADQHHGLYRVAAKSGAVALITVIREDCLPSTVTVSLTGTNASVKVGTRALAFDKRTVTVTK